MVPALCALIGCSIFIASRTTTSSPTSTTWPSSTAILTIVPCIGVVRASPEAAAPALPPPDRLGAFFLAAPPSPPRFSPPGRITSRRLPPTSTTTLWRSPAGSGASATTPAYGGMSLTNSVSIQRVCTVNGSAGFWGAKASSETTARWKGSTVGMPSMKNSDNARRARAKAWVRSFPVMMSLASIESNAPPMTSPDSTPESSRTPGPEGGRNTDTTPGAGRKLRPASSPLIRNSIEWPVGGGST